MRRNFSINSYWWSAGAPALAFLALLGRAGVSGAATPDASRPALEQQFARAARPFLQAYCVSCHGKDKPQAQLDLTALMSMNALTGDDSHCSMILDRVGAKQMPPADAGKQPSDKERAAFLACVRAARQAAALRSAGDPGPVLARRLSNAEYDYTIRDLTGVDLRPTREFPVDPANQEGFDNSGESLTFSSALMKKYTLAAKDIADHAVLSSAGLEFAPHPVIAETDRDKYCVLRIAAFYKRQPTDFADYFEAAWRYRYRAALHLPDATLQTIAAGAKISPRYLELVWRALNVSSEKVGPMAKLQTLWNALPAPAASGADTARAGCAALRNWVVTLRKEAAWRFDNLKTPRGFSAGGQVFVLWKDRQYASHRQLVSPERLQIGGVPATRIIPGRRNGGAMGAAKTVTDTVDADLFLPKEEAARAPYIAGFNRFCSVFPDAFYIAERGRMFVDDPGDKGRLLSAGFHSSMGYFRDDSPLMNLILNESEQRELNKLWLDFDLVAFVPERMHLEFFVYERAEARTINDPEFNFARPEDKDAVSDAKIKRLADAYLAKAKRNGGEPLALQAIEDHFKWVSAHIRGTERARIAAEPSHLKDLLTFAERAYRRPLTERERGSMLAFYQTLRQKEGLSHEDAIRDSLVGVLMSPNFLFRLDLEADAGAARPVAPLKPSVSLARQASARLRAVSPPVSGGGGVAVQPLPDYALASRLSYFLWASLPDKELLAHAAAGDLRRPEVLSAQARRMLRDPRARALAVEFGGNWLDFRRFEEHNAVDRERFPGFNDGLRESMYQEPVRFLLDTFQNNRSVLDMIYGKHTFVDAALARHYGMTGVKPGPGEWVRVDDAAQYGRGGLLPMAVFLTKNSPGLRTSPVKRGYWVVKRVLGETIPAPPPNVPALPSDESKMGNLTLRQALAQHRANPACAGCHARFDSYGLVFEGYGPIGERRNKDLGGKLVDAKAPFPGGVEGDGVAGLQDFIRRQRQDDFIRSLDRKMLSYALGRSLQPSDEPLLLQMRQKLAAENYRFGTLVDTIVVSRQFRNRRALSALARNEP